MLGIYTLPEFAAVVPMAQRTVRKYIQTGKLTPQKIKGRYRFTRIEVRIARELFVAAMTRMPEGFRQQAAKKRQAGTERRLADRRAKAQGEHVPWRRDG